MANNIFYKAHDFIILDGTLTVNGSLKQLQVDKGTLDIDNIAVKYNLNNSAIDLYLVNKTNILLPLSKNKGRKIHLQGKYNDINIQIQKNKVTGEGIINSSLFKNFPLIEESKGPIKLFFSYDIQNKDSWYLQISPKQKDSINLVIKEAYPDINIHDFLLVFSPSGVNLKHLSATRGSGKITGKGILSNKSTEANGISFDFNKIKFKSKLSYIRNIDSLLNGNIIIIGDKHPYKIIRNILIDESKSIDTHDIINEIATITNKTKIVNNKSLTEHLSPELDINIFKKYTINNRSIKATGAFDLSIQVNSHKSYLKVYILIKVRSYIIENRFKGAILYLMVNQSKLNIPFNNNSQLIHRIFIIKKVNQKSMLILK